jgi:hypothetical protein
MGTLRPKRRLWVAAPGGVLVAGMLTAIVVFVNSEFLSWILLWPLRLAWWAFPAPCFDQGPGRTQFCEGTPVQLMATAFGLVATVLWYGSLIYWLLGRKAHPAKPGRA